MNQKHRLGDLQIAIMHILWDQGEASASHVHTTLLEERGLAITTIKTMLRKMEERGLVTHRENGRQFIYIPLIEKQETRTGMVHDLIKRMFSGDSTALVNHLLNEGEIDVNEIEELKAQLSAKKRKKTK
ncbi:Methicillin resistance regulatory protein MecI [Poriferisphaera corsica]|uniref:Methicillin resistance regulatory protein MecI n=1 Tax=Poriferisphaera corsica TaxID=2528020 RepID=A0A517YTT3_9BACT|nr:BlaI/MecI/CopY family transcriptional regulator [Poriferisphaera corsica]QDU33619.1 Methicillin resistance regulatory protein MecI [Poriferisphaera corsica]